MRLRLLFLAATTLCCAGCMPVGRDFARPAPTTFKPGVSSIGDVKKVLGEPRTELSWSRTDGVFRERSASTPLPTPFDGARVNGTVKRLYYYYSWRAGQGVRSGVEPARSLYVWFWNDKLVAFTATSSFKDDTTSFDDSKVAAITPWHSLRADVVAAFGPPSGVAVYPAAPAEDHEVLIYSDFEWDTSKGQYGSKTLFVLVNALGLVEDVRFSGATNLIPAPVPGPSSTPIQIYTPPRTRNK
jgi:hypothetical protein